MKNKHFLVPIASLVILSSMAIGVDNANAHSKDALFNFNNAKQEAQNQKNEYSEIDQNKTPISNLVVNPDKEAVRMIVLTDKTMSERDQIELLGSYGSYGEKLVSVKGFTANISPTKLEEFKRKTGVKGVYQDTIVKGQNQYYTSKTVSAPQVWKEKGITGAGVSVAVLDTGVEAHSDLADDLVAFKDFVNNKTAPYDDNGHGTHIAGLITGSSSKSSDEILGIAKDTNIVSVKVLDSQESGYMSNVISGIDWVIENKDKYNIKVINLSLGATSTSKDDPLVQAVEKANAAGILVVAASGNKGGVMSPATASSAIAVGSTNGNGTVTVKDDKLASFSTKPISIHGNVKPEIYATGVNITSTLALGGSRAYNDRANILNSLYYKMSGTSMSAPQVSAIAALYYSKNPQASTAEVKRAIVNSAIDVNGLKIANAASLFGLSPVFEEILEQKPSSPNTGGGNSSSNNDIGITTEVNGKTDLPTDFFNYEDEETKNVEGEKEVSESIGDAVDNLFGDTNNNEGSNEEVDNNGTDANAGFGDESTNSFSNSNSTNKTPLTDAKIPVVDPYILNDGYPFVKQTYNKSNVLDKLLTSSKKYANEEELIYSYTKIEDIIKLYNILNRSFTQEDFLYFDQRLNTHKKETLEEKKIKAAQEAKELEKKLNYTFLNEED